MFRKIQARSTYVNSATSASARNLILAIGFLLAAGSVIAGYCPPYSYQACGQAQDPPKCDTCPCPPGSGGGPGGGGGGAGGGGGSPYLQGDNASSGASDVWSGCGSCGSSGANASSSGEIVWGMPYAWVSEPALQLRLEDDPLGTYKPGLGPQPSYRLSYRQRSGIPEEDGYFSFGTNWSCSLRKYVIDLNDGSGIVRMHRGGAGFVDYINGVTQRREASVMQIVTPHASCQLNLPDGGKEIYQQAFTSGSYVLLFITQKLDPQGNAVTYNYSTIGGVLKLTSVTDADGHSTSLYYENATFPNRVTKVVDPFNRTNLLKYDDLGYVTNLTDAQGLQTSFKYDSGTHFGWLTNMTTPYGTTSFSFGGVDVDQDDYPSFTYDINRFIEITLPNGGKELYAYRADCDNFMSQTYASVPSTSPFDNTLDNIDQYYRNSFHWGPLQYSHLHTADPGSFNTADYAIGRLRHWLLVPGTISQPAPSLSLERLPSPDGSTPGQLFWYDYPDKPSGQNNQIGSSDLESLRAWVLPDGTPHFERSIRNSFGWVTNHVATYSAPDGTVALRTNTLIYNANDIDLVLHIGPNREQVVSNYYGNVYHQPVASYDALNQATLYLFNGNRQLIRTIDPAGLTTTNIYAPGGTDINRLTNTTALQIFRTNSYIYTNALVFTHKDPRGLTTTNCWDKLQRLTAVYYPDGTYITNVYTNLDLIATKDRLNQWRYFGYNQVRQLTAATNENGVVTRYSYCECGALMSLTNAWHTSVEQFSFFSNDFQGNRLITTNSDGYAVTNWFDSLRRVTITGDGTTYRYFYYNNQGLVTNVSNTIGPEKQTVFDIEDRPQYVTDINGVTVTNTYDDLNRLRTCGYPDGGVEKFGYSARGVVAYTNQIGATNFFAYDEGRRKIFVTNANSELIRYTNNAAGDVLSLADGKNQTTRWNYDEYGRVTNKLDQAGAEILRYKYDQNNRLTNRWSAAKGDTKYTYDPVGNLTFIDYPSSVDVALQYDWLNRLTNMSDAVGTTKYTYTSGNQLLTEDGPFDSDTLTNKYVNRMRTNLSLQQPTSFWTNKFVYDPARRLTNVISPAGSFAYTVGATAPSSALIRKLLLPNTSYITNTYDINARVTGTYLKKSDNTTVFDSYAYIYDPANERTNLTRADGSSISYTYDKIGQLTVADSPVYPEGRSYFYDSAWNLNRRTNASIYVDTFTVDGLNEITNTDQGPCYYDANGNLVARDFDFYSPGPWATYCYDDENRLVRFIYADGLEAPLGCDDAPPNLMSGIRRTDFVYDGFGRLRERLEYGADATFTTDPIWVLGVETLYIYDGMRVIQERDMNNTPYVSYTRGTDLSGSLARAGGIGGLLARSGGYSGGNWTDHNFYFADGNGNITYMLNSSQTMVASYRYDPFGNTFTSDGTLAGDNVYRFSSKENHANSGMYYYGYRFYDPFLQRWINRDPLGTGVGGILPKFPSELWAGPNQFRFDGNQPLSRIDPSGLFDGEVGHSDPLGQPTPNWDENRKGCPLPPCPRGQHQEPYWKVMGYSSFSACVNSEWDHNRDTIAGILGAIAGGFLTKGSIIGTAVGGGAGALLIPNAICHQPICVN